jgi:hypothetical protein
VLAEVEKHKKRCVVSSSSRGILYYSIHSKLEYNKRTHIKDTANIVYMQAV